MTGKTNPVPSVTLSLDRQQAEALLGAGHAGVAALQMSSDDADQELADRSQDVLYVLATLMQAAGWVDD